jgi:hypothetical protein
MAYLALTGYVAVVLTHIVAPGEREDVLVLARANAHSRFSSYEQNFGYSQAVARVQHRKAQADLDALQNPSAFALQWYQLRHINWARHDRHWLVWGVAFTLPYLVGVLNAWLRTWSLTA